MCCLLWIWIEWYWWRLYLLMDDIMIYVVWIMIICMNEYSDVYMMILMTYFIMINGCMIYLFFWCMIWYEFCYMNLIYYDVWYDFLIIVCNILMNDIFVMTANLIFCDCCIWYFVILWLWLMMIVLWFSWYW